MTLNNPMIQPHPKPKNLRSKKYLDFIKSKPCIWCGRSEAEPHHERRFSDGGTGLKPSDIYAVPVCRVCHGKLQRYEIDALAVYVWIVKLLTEYLEGKI